MSKDLTKRKILIAGLDDSGKTSIVYSLQGIKNLPKFLNIRPTVGRNIENIEAFESEFSIWDLGGQEAYRDEHLKDFKTNIEGCNKFIYVFDVQDSERYGLALSYFKQFINLLKEETELTDLEISIFLHKFDPDLKVTHPGVNTEVINELKDSIKEIIDKTNFLYQIFKTTIYALFEKIITD
ncbi:MAG: ADP-ribosylation factor-like protein [Promethearchaeota archaeon]